MTDQICKNMFAVYQVAHREECKTFTQQQNQFLNNVAFILIIINMDLYEHS